MLNRLRGPIAEGLMDPLGLVPDPVQSPAHLCLRKRGVVVPVDFFRLVMPEEALDVRLVFQALDIGVL